MLVEIVRKSQEARYTAWISLCAIRTVYNLSPLEETSSGKRKNVSLAVQVCHYALEQSVGKWMINQRVLKGIEYHRAERNQKWNCP